MQHVVSSGALVITYCTPSNLLNRHRIYALKEKHQIAQLIRRSLKLPWNPSPSQR